MPTRRNVKSRREIMADAGRKSWITRKLNLLQEQYEVATAGKKSHIRKQMRELTARYAQLCTA